MEPQFVKTVSIIGFITLFFIIIGAITMYTYNSGDYVPNNKKSEDKITILNEAFRSILGNNWPYVLLVLTLFLGAILYLLYLISISGSLSLNMSEQAGQRFNTLFLIFIVLFTLFIIILGIKAFLNNDKKNSIPNYTPDTDTKARDKKILIIIGLILFIVFGGGMTIWYIRNKKLVN